MGSRPDSVHATKKGGVFWGELAEQAFTVLSGGPKGLVSHTMPLPHRKHRQGMSLVVGIYSCSHTSKSLWKDYVPAFPPAPEKELWSLSVKTESQ